ncbi:MAG TPA: hypothetical protein VHV10_00980 [Ktedonobacteraceae bacterium]|nr:hypothetical protein [Ktedonobacteraceae bacterium]
MSGILLMATWLIPCLIGFVYEVRDPIPSKGSACSDPSGLLTASPDQTQPPVIFPRRED